MCGSCSNWVDFVKSGCEKSWAEVQADSFSFECRGCTKMKELEVELEELKLLVVAMVGREGSRSYVGKRKLDLWGSFVGRADMYKKDGLHLSGKGAAVFTDKLSAAVDSDTGTMTNIFGSKHCLN